MGTEDERLDAIVRSIPVEDWVRFDELATAFRDDPEPAKDHPRAREDDGTYTPGWWEYSPTVEALIRWMYHTDIIVGGFDWPEWDGVANYRSPHAIEAAPIADVLRMATGIVRGDRFHDGTLAAAINDGLIGAIVDRLESWHTANA